MFADNLYLYGPLIRVLTEDLPAVDYGRKPKTRAEVNRLWQAAHGAGRVQAVAVRSPDFYGPSVVQSVLGEASIAALAQGRTAMLLGNADVDQHVANVVLTLAPLEAARNPVRVEFGRNSGPTWSLGSWRTRRAPAPSCRRRSVATY